MSSGMKRKFCLTPNPSQAGLDIPSVPKVTERLRDIHLDRDISRISGSTSSSNGSKTDASPGCKDDVFSFDEIEFNCNSSSLSSLASKVCVIFQCLYCEFNNLISIILL